MSSLRVAYVSDQFLDGDATDTLQIASMASAFGAEGATLSLILPALAERPVSVADIARRYAVEPTFEVVGRAGPYPAPFGFRGLEKVAHAVSAGLHARSGYDVVYTRNLPVVIAALVQTQLPVFYETYRPWPSQAKDKRALFSLLRRHPRMRGLILHSRFAAASYRDVGFGEEQLLVAHNGIDPRRFAEPLSTRAARARLGLPEDGTLCVYTGHISPQKGLGIVLDAAERLPDIGFALVGSSGEGPIERRARALPNARVVPWQAPGDIACWLMAADLLLIPPTRGPLDTVGNTVLPIKTFQYMAAGRAIIAPDAPDVGEVLTDGVNACLTAPEDVGAFVGALTRLSGDAAERERLGQHARATALDNTWAARAARILRWIEARR